jgi:hypothetical protein
VIVDIGSTGNGGSFDSATGRWLHGPMVSADTDAEEGGGRHSVASSLLDGCLLF